MNNPTTYTSKVETSSPLGGLTIYSLRTGVDNVVAFCGSLLGGGLFASDNILVPEMTASLLDLGTKQRDKFEIASALESVGAKLGFSSGRHRVHFSGKCLKKDIPLVIQLLAEQLIFPAFEEQDLNSTIQRRKAELKQLKEDTRTRAVEAFLLRLYPEKHPNRPKSLSDQQKATNTISVNQLKKFHSDHYGLGSLNICFVGDVDHENFENHTANHFGQWQNSSASIKESTLKAKRLGKGVETSEHIPDKTSADLVTGHGIGIDKEHQDYYPVMMSHFILGGNFSARLMATVRDREGLTYGVQSTTGGVDQGNDGYWYIWGTFGPKDLEKAKESINKQLDLWYKEGVTAEELNSKKSTITGMYQVGLDTTSGLARRILTTVERGKELSFMDEYPKIITAITLDQVNKSIQTYCDPGKRITVVAGTVDESN
tara:strand:- start:27398 stop:28684 length:1287 start_codon:yes stop_codon:yes gene_type:complete